MEREIKYSYSYSYVRIYSSGSPAWEVRVLCAPACVAIELEFRVSSRRIDSRLVCGFGVGRSPVCVLVYDT